MKKLLSFLMLGLMLVMLVNAQSVKEDRAAVEPEATWSTRIVPVCEDVCVEGSQIDWQVQIKNTGEVDLDLNSLSLVDSSGVEIARKSFDEDQENTIPAGEVGKVSLKGIVPPPTRGSTLYYGAVYHFEQGQSSDESYRRMTVMPLKEVECSSNEECGKGELCNEHRCVPYDAFNESFLRKNNVERESESGMEDVQTVLLSLIVIMLALTIYILSSGKKK